jgi:hypothetical protein
MDFRASIRPAEPLRVGHPRSVPFGQHALDTVLGTGGWKPSEPAARMAALRSARCQRAGGGIFQMPGASQVNPVVTTVTNCAQCGGS